MEVESSEADRADVSALIIPIALNASRGYVRRVFFPGTACLEDRGEAWDMHVR